MKKIAAVATLLVLSVCLFLLPSCSSVEIPERSLKGKQTSAEVWKKILKQHVNAKGQVDFSAIASSPEDLEVYLTAQRKITPRSHPEKYTTKTSQLVYYINTYNALAMYHAATSGVEPKQLLKFFVSTKFDLGGEKISLKALEDSWIRPLDEPRLHFVLNCMVKSCPRLLQEPMSEKTLESQLEKATIEFLNDPKHVKVDQKNQQVHISAIMKWYKKDFLIKHKSLLDYINAYRKDKIPSNYKISYLDYDWSLNQQ